VKHRDQAQGNEATKACHDHVTQKAVGEPNRSGIASLATSGDMNLLRSLHVLAWQVPVTIPSPALMLIGMLDQQYLPS